MSREKDKVSSKVHVNTIATVSLLVSLIVFFINDYIGAQAEADQGCLNNLTLAILFIIGIANLVLVIKKRATVLMTISLLVALGLLVYTLISMSIHITF